MRKLYLSDGVYATIDLDNHDYPVILTTGHHEIRQADQVIYMEQSALNLLAKAIEDEKNTIIQLNLPI